MVDLPSSYHSFAHEPAKREDEAISESPTLTFVTTYSALVNSS